jgi:hypothetical protein
VVEGIAVSVIKTVGSGVLVAVGAEDGGGITAVSTTTTSAVTTTGRVASITSSGPSQAAKASKINIRRKIWCFIAILFSGANLYI